MDQDNPYRYVTSEGRVQLMTEEEAIKHINSLAKKYMGKDKYPYLSENEVRVKIGIKPNNILKME